MMQTPTVALPSHEWIDRGGEELEKKKIQSGDCIGSLIEQAALPISEPLFI